MLDQWDLIHMSQNIKNICSKISSREFGIKKANSRQILPLKNPKRKIEMRYSPVKPEMLWLHFL